MAYKRILIKGDVQQGEGVAAEVLTPGELVEYDSNEKLALPATAGGNLTGMVVREYTQIGNDIDDDYAADDDVLYVVPQPGAVLYCWLADGENVSRGDLLVTDTNGHFTAHTPQAVDEGGTGTFTIYLNAVKFMAEEDLNNSAGGAPARIKVRRI